MSRDDSNCMTASGLYESLIKIGKMPQNWYANETNLSSDPIPAGYINDALELYHLCISRNLACVDSIWAYPTPLGGIELEVFLSESGQYCDSLLITWNNKTNIIEILLTAYTPVHTQIPIVSNTPTQMGLVDAYTEDADIARDDPDYTIQLLDTVQRFIDIPRKLRSRIGTKS